MLARIGIVEIAFDECGLGDIRPGDRDKDVVLLDASPKSFGLVGETYE
jgi:hypothetical protein